VDDEDGGIAQLPGGLAGFNRQQFTIRGEQGGAAMAGHKCCE
jgi:hypothetical protein